MKELYKNPTLYYLLVPAAIAVWPLLVWGRYLPQSKEILSNEVKYSNDGQVTALEILRLDPERLSFADANNTGDEFSYATAVDKVAGMCGIPASKYKLSTGPLMKKDKQRTQSAHLRFDQVSMVPFAKFLSLMQLRASPRLDAMHLHNQFGFGAARDQRSQRRHIEMSAEHDIT